MLLFHLSIETEKASGRKSRRDISQAGKSRDNSSDYYSEYNSNYDGEYSDDELDMDEDDIRFVRTTCDALYISNTNHDSRASDVGKEKAKDIEMGQQIENIKIPTHVLSNETDQDQSFSYEDPSDYGYSSEDKGRISEPTPSSSQTVSSSGRVGKFSSEQLPMMRHREMQQFLYRINSFSSSRPSGSAKMPVARDSNNSVLSMDVGHRKSSNASPDASARKVNRNRESHSERESTASSVKDDKESTENPMRAVEMSSLSHT